MVLFSKTLQERCLQCCWNPFLHGTSGAAAGVELVFQELGPSLGVQASYHWARSSWPKIAAYILIREETLGNRKLDIETRLSKSGTCLGSPSAGVGEGEGGSLLWAPSVKALGMRPTSSEDMTESLFFLIKYALLSSWFWVKFYWKEKKNLKPQQLNPFENPLVPILLRYCMQIRMEAWRMAMTENGE